MRRQRGFTLIELLIVVAIIGIIAAIAIPNLLNAINRGRQKRTMADIRSIGTAMESYQVDWNFYPANVTQANVGLYITPTYIKIIPVTDGWDNTIGIVSDTNGTTYTIWSIGKPVGNEAAPGTVPAVAAGPTRDFTADIVFSEGRFVSWPAGMQT